MVPALQGISGVANVNPTGVRNQIVQVTLDLDKLKDQGLSATQVQSLLQSNNLTVPAGTLSIRVGNTFNSLDDLKNVIVGQHTTQQTANCSQQSAGSAGTGSAGAGSPGGSQLPPGVTPPAGAGTSTAQRASCPAPTTNSTPVKLSDVATVQQTLTPSSTLTRTNSKDSLAISVTKASSGNTVSISQEIQKQISTLQTSSATMRKSLPSLTRHLQSASLLTAWCARV